MEQFKKSIMNLTDRIENSCAVGAIRQGMIMLIPLLVVGYLSAMLVNLPIPAYQTFMAGLCDGRVVEVLQCINTSVNDFFSVFLAATTSVSYSMMKRKRRGIYESTGNVIILVIITLAAFAGYSGIQYDTFSISMFSNMHAFTALVVALVSGEIYFALKNIKFFQVKRQGTNTDSIYIEALEGIGPAVIIIGFFSLFHQLLDVLFGVSGLQELMERIFNFFLEPLENGLGAGLIVVILTHGLWFFGVHGHNMLDVVIKQNYARCFCNHGWNGCNALLSDCYFVVRKEEECSQSCSYGIAKCVV